MYLRTLSVENFRSIRSAKLEFDDTTVLIGENESGKSSLIEALARALAPEDAAPQFEPHHFHRSQGGPDAVPVGAILIELVFEERRAGEWSRVELGALSSLLDADASRPRRLVLRLHAPPPPDEGPVNAQWEIVSPGARQQASQNDPRSLALLRGINRFIWLRGGTLLGPGWSGAAKVSAPGRFTDDIAPLVREIEESFQSLISGTTRHMQSELKAGYDASRELLARHAVELHSAGALTRSIVEEILGRRATKAGRRTLAFHGSAAQQLGVLILTAAILRHISGEPLPGAEFILALEDPEAHLHLMTLASVWGLLDQIEAQKIITTQSGTLLAAAPLHGLRRISRHEGVVRQWLVRKGTLDAEELRKLSYHIRVRRDEASFARCWLLVEGETEFWMLPELARLCGYDLMLEGVACVEFAQCGLAPLIKVAHELGIEWHVLADGDQAGRNYAATARTFLGNEPGWRRVTALRQRDIEHCFWKHGYARVFQRAAGVTLSPNRRVQPRSIINRAIKRHSKPQLAFELIVAAAGDDSPGVPEPLKRMIDGCVQLAREVPGRKVASHGS